MFEKIIDTIAEKSESLIESYSQKYRIGTKAIKEFLLKEIKAFLMLVLIGIITFYILVVKVGIARELYYITFLLIIFDVLAIFALITRNNYRKIKDNPRWNEHEAELKYSWGLNGTSGLVLGKDSNRRYAYSPESEEYMALCIGAPGSGKSSAFAIPSIRKWNGNVFALDVAGDIVNNTAPYRPSEAKIIKIGTDDYKNSASYDIMYDIDNAESDYERLEAIETLACQLYAEDPKFDSTARYYNEEAREFFIGCFLHFYSSKTDFLDLCEVLVSHSGQQLLDMVMMGHNQRAKSCVSGNVGIPDTLMANIKQAVDRKIDIFVKNPMFKEIIHRPKKGQKSVNSHSLENGDVYVQIPERKLDMYKTVLSIIITENISYLSARTGDTPILLMIDEFARLEQMLPVKSALMTIRKRKVRIALCIQSISSLNELYGINGAKEIIDCCSLKLLMQVNNQDTQEMMSKTIGERYVYIRNERRYWGTNEGYMVCREKERNIAPEELGYLGDELIVINPSGYKRLKKAYYFEG